jgi:hypothetical protein
MAETMAVAAARPRTLGRPGGVVALAIATAAVLCLTLAYVRGPVRRSIEDPERLFSGFMPAPCYAGQRPPDPPPSAELRAHRARHFDRTQAVAIALVVLFGVVLGIGALARGDALSRLGISAAATGVLGAGLCLFEPWACALLIPALAYPLSDVLDRRHFALDRLGLGILLSAGMFLIAVTSLGATGLVGWEALLLPMVGWCFHVPFLIAWQLVPAPAARKG